MRRALIASLALALPAAAADLTGTWVGYLEGKGGDRVDMAFRFVQSGTKLDGKLYGDYRSTALTRGKVVADVISFELLTQEQAGNQINETKQHFEGALRDGELVLMRQREGSRDAGNGGNVVVKDQSKQTVRLKRLL